MITNNTPQVFSSPGNSLFTVTVPSNGYAVQVYGSFDMSIVLGSMTPGGTGAFYSTGGSIWLASSGGPSGCTIVATLDDRLPSLPFSGVAVLTSAASGTAVHVIPDANVPAGKRCYVDEIAFYVRGGTAWSDSTGTKVLLQDTAAVEFLEVAKAGLTANRPLSFYTSSVTLSAAITSRTGGTLNKGIDIVADHNFAAGSDLCVYVAGHYGD